MLCASAGDTAGQDLAALADEVLQLGGILVINVFDLVCAEMQTFLLLPRLNGRAGRAVFSVLSMFILLHAGHTRLIFCAAPCRSETVPLSERQVVVGLEFLELGAGTGG